MASNSESKSFIIQFDAKAVDWFTLRSEIYLKAEQKGLKSYIIEGLDNSSIPSVTSLNQLLKSDYEILKKTLKKQSDAEEKTLVNDLKELVKEFPPYIYELNQVPTSNDPAVPPGITELDFENARNKVFIPEQAFKEFLKKNRTKISTTPVGLSETAQRLLNSNYFSPFNGTPEERARAAATVYIPIQHAYKVIEREAARDKRIKRFEVTDTVETLKEKLTESYLSDAEKQIQDQIDHHSKAVLRSNDINGRLLAFFNDTIAGVSSSVAAEVIRKQEWFKVMGVLNNTFTDQLNNSNATTFLQKLLDLKLEDGESIQHFIERVRSIVSAIQEINQVMQSKLIRIKQYTDLTSIQCQSLLELTDDEFLLKYPDSKAYVSESTILQSLVKACSDPSCRLHVAADKFKTKQYEKGSLSVIEFFKDMRFGEDILPEAEQVRLNVYETNYVKPISNINHKIKSKRDSSLDSFCAYHSHDEEAPCWHNTSNCTKILNGETRVDPNNSKFHVLQSDGSHFKSNRKRNQNSKSSDKSGKNKKKECSICLAASKADSSFNKGRITSHTTANHREYGKKDSSKTSGYPTTSNAGAASTKEATSKYEEILTPLQKIITQFTKTVKALDNQSKKNNNKRKKADEDEDNIN